ncbi:MAG: hypothetical protein ACJ76D_03610 [Solirubrobacterales bacterium]
MSPFGIGRSRRRQPKAADSDKPILAVDIDGVLLLFGFEEPPQWPAAEMALVGGAMHCISRPASERLRKLAGSFEVVWATGWEGRSSEIASRLDLPEFPFLVFDGAARFGSAHWKTAPLEEYARGRPLAWLDDSLEDRCYEWARSRPEPTLLVEVESHLGLQEVHVEALAAWAKSLAADRSERPGG